MASIPQERAQEIIDQLRGTCKAVYEVVEPGEDADDRFLCEEIDAELFECVTCGWWCEHCERAEGPDDECMECAGV